MAVVLTRKQSIWLGVGLLAAFFAASGLVISSRGSGGIPVSKAGLSKELIEGAVTPSPEGTISQTGGIILNDFHRSLVRDGKTLWEVFGKRGRYAPGSQSAEIEEPQLTVSRSNGDSLVVSAKRAVLNLAGTELKSADLYDDVRLRYKDDTTLKTAQATFLQQENKVVIPVFVEVENDLMKVTGNRLTADLNTQEFIVENDVKSVVKPRIKK